MGWGSRSKHGKGLIIIYDMGCESKSKGLIIIYDMGLGANVRGLLSMTWDVGGEGAYCYL